MQPDLRIQHRARYPPNPPVQVRMVKEPPKPRDAKSQSRGLRQARHGAKQPPHFLSEPVWTCPGLHRPKLR